MGEPFSQQGCEPGGVVKDPQEKTGSNRQEKPDPTVRKTGSDRQEKAGSGYIKS